MPLSLELVDAGLILARGEGDRAPVVAEEPGVAILEDTQTVTGLAAEKRLRLRPLQAQVNFWRDLNTEFVARPSRVARTHADIAFAHLRELLQQHRAEGEGLLLAVPAGYSREQLGLLLGIVNETGAPVLGLVDAALAASSALARAPRILHLDIELHQTMLTILDRTQVDGAVSLRRTRFELLPRQGLLALRQTWLQFIAEHFVRRTRFDPLHDAVTEQRLLDSLSGWLAALPDNGAMPLALEFLEQTFSIELSREEFIAAAERHYAEIVRLVQSNRPAGMAIELHLTDRLAELPGLRERLAGLRDCEIVLLPRGASAAGAIALQPHISRSAESLALINQVPIALADASSSNVPSPSATPAPLRPSHVVFQGRAYRISEEPLAIGWAVADTARALTVPSGGAGVSRSHCSIVRSNGSVLLYDRSTYGSFVNDERVVGSVVLTIGDRLRLGTPGITLDLIQLVTDDGAPQD